MASHIQDLTADEWRLVGQELVQLGDTVANVRNGAYVPVRAMTVQALLDVLAHAE